MYSQLQCITCNNSLRDTAKVTPDYTQVYCTCCNARYAIVPAVDENGFPKTTPDGKTQLFLDPISPGNLPDNPVNHESIKTAIRECRTPKDFIEKLKTIEEDG